MSYSGSCLCGAVRYSFDCEPRTVVNCHCSACRKATGSAFATWVLVPRDHFRWTAGEEKLKRFDSSEHGQRFFCGTCGAKMGNLSSQRPSIMHIGAGTLDDAPQLRVELHAYVASKAPWHQIRDELPQFDELPPRPAR